MLSFERYVRYFEYFVGDRTSAGNTLSVPPEDLYEDKATYASIYLSVERTTEKLDRLTAAIIDPPTHLIAHARNNNN